MCYSKGVNETLKEKTHGIYSFSLSGDFYLTKETVMSSIY